MKKWIYMPILAGLVIGGCASDNSEPANQSELGVINLDPFVPKMIRGADVTVSSLASGMSVYAYKSGSTDTPYINGVKFVQSGEYWSSMPLSYWPGYALDFWGYYPTTVAPTAVTDPAQFSYTVVSNVNDQQDVVVAYTANQNTRLVDMMYRHALSKVSFKITSVANSDLNITVNGISVKNIPMSADFVFNTSGTVVPDFFAVSNQTPANPSTGEATLTLPTPVSIVASTEIVSSDLISGFYLIPHTLVNWSYDQDDAFPMTGTYININGTLSGLTAYEGDIAIPITTEAWQPGYHYVYNIEFGNLSGPTGGGGYDPNRGADGNTKPEQVLLPIKVSVTVDTWIDVTEPPYDM